MTSVSGRATGAADAFATVRQFFETRQRWMADRPEACDFTFGNPHEMPLPGLVAALRQGVEPSRPDWFAYKTSEAEPRSVVADALRRELDLPFEPEDIALTQGAFGAIALAFRLVMDAGAEVVIPVPGWFCYAPMLRAADLVPVKVALEPGRFDLDLAAIDAAITPRTRMIVVNSPNNPTGRIYDRAHLAALADLLEAASTRIGARIWLLSDEPYRRIASTATALRAPPRSTPGR
jgi:aspartate aminotransferase